MPRYPNSLRAFVPCTCIECRCTMPNALLFCLPIIPLTPIAIFSTIWNSSPLLISAWSRSIPEYSGQKKCSGANIRDGYRIVATCSDLATCLTGNRPGQITHTLWNTRMPSLLSCVHPNSVFYFNSYYLAAK
jgi:hypothetical protein